MSILLRVVLGLAALAAVVLVALAVAVPRYAASPEVRARLEGAVRDATGRAFDYEELDVSLLPPGLVLRHPRIAGAAEGDPPFAEAEAVRLRVALLPLLGRTVLVDSLVLVEPALRLERTADGIAWPRPEREDEPEEPRERRREAPEARRGFDFGIRTLRVRGGALHLEDRAVDPPVRWDLREVDGRARVDGREGPLHFELDARLGEGGRLEGRGEAALDRRVDACVRLDGVDLALLGPYLEDGALAGDAHGALHLRGAAGATDRLALVLDLRGARLDVEELRADGDLGLEATLAGPPFTGPFRIDATGASLAAGGSVGFRKPPGLAATAVGQLAAGGEGYSLESVQVQIGGEPPAATRRDPCAPEPAAEGS